jgi:hypothetical protein
MKNPQKAYAIAAVLIAAIMGLIIWLIMVPRQPTDVAPPLPLKPLVTWTNELMLTDEELPAGWRYDTSTTYDRPGVSGRFYGFYNTIAGRDALAVSLSEEFGLYPTTLEATRFYTSWANDFISPQATWENMPDLDFPTHADQMKIVCLLDQIHGIPNRDCMAIARYQNVIVKIFGVVYEERWLSIADFRSTLQAADRRITGVLSRQK